MSLREAAEVAIKTLDYAAEVADRPGLMGMCEKAAELLRTALAEAEEPVAWRTEAAAWLRRQADDAEPESGRTGWMNPAHHMPATFRRIAEKLDAEQEAAPFGIECPPSPRREPLTEEQIRRLYRGAWTPESEADEVLAFARAIERAHGIGGDE